MVPKGFQQAPSGVGRNILSGKRISTHFRDAVLGACRVFGARVPLSAFGGETCRFAETAIRFTTQTPSGPSEKKRAPCFWELLLKEPPQQQCVWGKETNGHNIICEFSKLAPEATNVSTLETQVLGTLPSLANLTISQKYVSLKGQRQHTEGSMVSRETATKRHKHN